MHELKQNFLKRSREMKHETQDKQQPKNDRKQFDWCNPANEYQETQERQEPKHRRKNTRKQKSTTEINWTHQSSPVHENTSISTTTPRKLFDLLMAFRCSVLVAGQQVAMYRSFANPVSDRRLSGGLAGLGVGWAGRGLNGSLLFYLPVMSY